MLTRRQMEILMSLVKSGRNYSGQELADFYNVNKRTIRFDIQKIKSFLEKYNINIESSNRIGYRIPKEDLAKIYDEKILNRFRNEQEYYLPQTPNERVSFLCFLLSQKKKFRISELEGILYLSETSIYNTLQTLKEVLSDKFKNVELVNDKGFYYIKGEEKDKRNLLSGIISQKNNQLLEDKYCYYMSEDDSFKELLYKIIYLITNMQDDLNFSLSGEGIYSFSVDIALSCFREQSEEKLDYENKSLSSEIKRIKIILDNEDVLINSLNENNWCFLMDRFMSKSFIKFAKNIYEINDTVNNVCNDYFQYIENTYKINYINDDKTVENIKELFYQYEQDEKFDYYTPAIDKTQVTDEYLFCYLLALEFSYCVYLKSNKLINIPYLSKFTLIFVDAMFRNKYKKKAILVSNNDKAHIQLLLHKLVSNFGDSFDLLKFTTAYGVYYKNAELENYDLIISTESIENIAKQKTVYITPLCTLDDCNKISKYLSNDNITDAFNYKKVYINNIDTLMNGLHIAIQNSDHEGVVSIVNNFDLDLISAIINEKDKLVIITPFVQVDESEVIELILENPIFYKKKEYDKLCYIFYEKAKSSMIRDNIDKYV